MEHFPRLFAAWFCRIKVVKVLKVFKDVRAAVWRRAQTENSRSPHSRRLRPLHEGEIHTVRQTRILRIDAQRDIEDSGAVRNVVERIGNLAAIDVGL